MSSSEESEEEDIPKAKPITEEVHFLYEGQNHKEVPNNLTHARLAPGVKQIQRAAFHSCEQLVSVQLYEGLEVIGAAAFGTCASLTEIIIPNSVHEIARAAFDFCPLLANVKLPEKLVTIQCRLFYLCRSLKTIDIPKTVTSIGPHAFFECENLQSIDLPDGLSKICHSAFGGCTSLKEIDVPSSVKRIGTSAFRDCKNLALLKLPEGLEEVSEGLCENCSSLRALGLPSTVVRIGTDAFRECFKLVSLEMPGTLQEIEEGALSDCQVSVVIFPAGTKLENDAFERNVSIEPNKFPLEELPIHRVCYYQSFHSLPMNLEKLEHATVTNPKCLEDENGNTPFHVLATSFSPNVYLFQKLLEKYPVELLNQANRWNQAPVDYLYRSKAPGSAQLFEQVLQVTILQRSRFLGLEGWRMDVLQRVKEVLMSSEEERANDDPSFLEESCGSRALGQLRRSLLQYERLEATALLESALWKRNMPQRLLLLLRRQEEDEYSPKHVQKKRKVNATQTFCLPSCLSTSSSASTEKCCFGIKLFGSKPDGFIPTSEETTTISSSISFGAPLNEDERHAFLVHSGAEIVIPNVLPYLGPVSKTL
ncbi:unnamed protein product [Cylindrotheca closterium]|uniref:Uncharacterized protein n=1 Tax=Cylindrotheca closterium TaxID=2856 RepID=A0AAD2G458_9STRA|nr:unnamed protein product [Cylindrotheca closterium]